MSLGSVNFESKTFAFCSVSYRQSSADQHHGGENTSRFPRCGKVTPQCKLTSNLPTEPGKVLTRDLESPFLSMSRNKPVTNTMHPCKLELLWTSIGGSTRTDAGKTSSYVQGSRVHLPRVYDVDVTGWAFWNVRCGRV